jgi:protein-tyrosine phosphatase
MRLQTVVSLLTPEESIELNVDSEAQACRGHGIEFVSFGIPDRGVPESREEAVQVLQRLHDSLLAGHRVGLHCRQGIGRSGLMAAAVLILGGAAPEAAMTSVSHARGLEVPETAEQRAWLIDFAARLRHAPI